MKDLIEKIKGKIDLRIAVIIGLSIIMLLLLIQIFFFPDIFKAPLSVTSTYPVQDGQLDTTGSLTFRFNRDLDMEDITVSDNYGAVYTLTKVESAVVSARPSTTFIPRSYIVTVSSETTTLKELSFTVVDAGSVDVDTSGTSDNNILPALDLAKLADDVPIYGEYFVIGYIGGDIVISVDAAHTESASISLGILRQYGISASYERLDIREFSSISEPEGEMGL